MVFFCGFVSVFASVHAPLCPPPPQLGSMCLCQSTYEHVNLCNCGCPFKGPSQICPRPFDQAFCDSPALGGPGDGRLCVCWVGDGSGLKLGRLWF